MSDPRAVFSLLLLVLLVLVLFNYPKGSSASGGYVGMTYRALKKALEDAKP